MAGMLRVDEVARRLNCSTRTIRRWIGDGSLKSVKVHGLRLIPASAFDQMVGNCDPAWLDEVTVQIAAEKVIPDKATGHSELSPSLNWPPKTSPPVENLKQADLFEFGPVRVASTANMNFKNGDDKDQ